MLFPPTPLFFGDDNNMAVVMGGGVKYILRDLFTTALAAGSVNGTLAEPEAPEQSSREHATPPIAQAINYP